jgi:hypothetical protein
MKGLNMMDIATWGLPDKFAGDRTNSIIARVQHYRFKQKHELRDGTKVIPTLQTCIYVVRAYDEFGEDFPVAVDVESYTVDELLD